VNFSRSVFTEGKYYRVSHFWIGAIMPAKCSRSVRKVKIAISYVAIGLGVYLLVGCIYIPLPEHKVGDGKDFRDLVGEAHSTRPIRAGIARSAVERLLGKPEHVSSDGRVIRYTIYTEKSFVIWPLCFSAGPDVQKGYALALEFDEKDMLVGWQMDDATSSYGGRGSWPSEEMRKQAIQALILHENALPEHRRRSTTEPADDPH
jgi:hypothetical protein